MAKKDKGTITGEPVTYQVPAPAGGVQMETFIPWTLVKRSVRRQVITPIDAPEAFEAQVEKEQRQRIATQDTPLLRALGLAHYWNQLLERGKYRSLTEIAALEGVNVTHVRRLLRLVILAPRVVEALMAADGKGVTLESLLRQSLPVDWQGQEALLS
jgi:hypothetical protein